MEKHGAAETLLSNQLQQPAQSAKLCVSQSATFHRQSFQSEISAPAAWHQCCSCTAGQCSVAQLHGLLQCLQQHSHAGLASQLTPTHQAQVTEPLLEAGLALPPGLHSLCTAAGSQPDQSLGRTKPSPPQQTTQAHLMAQRREGSRAGMWRFTASLKTVCNTLTPCVARQFYAGHKTLR